MMPIRKVLIKYNIHVISLLIFYENINNMIFKVFSSVVYCIIDNDVCDDYLCCTQTKPHVANKVLKTQHTMIIQELVFLNY